ncbi:MAG: sulfotransferase [Betaproteobacteria bacterium]
MTRSIFEFQRQVGEEMASGDWRAATRTAQQCRATHPSDPVGWLLGSFAALSANEKEEALRLAEAGLVIDPNEFQCGLQRAEALLALGRRSDAVEATHSAVNRVGDIPAALDAAGTFFVHASEQEQALQMFDRAVAVAPQERRYRARRAMVLRYLGDFERAQTDYDAILAANPTDAEALKSRGELRLLSAGMAPIADLEAALAAQEDVEQRIALHFALSKAYHDTGDYPTSWRHLSAGNNLQRAQLRYDPEQDRQIFAAITQSFPTPEPAGEDDTGESPIFILGLPRTGTTLVERIIGSHSAVHSAGELAALSAAAGNAVNRIRPVEDLDWIGFAQTLGQVSGAEVARGYLAESRAWRGTKARFSDKQPTNFFYCGVLLRAFPQARIVHLTRHPMAATYAIYKTRFRRTYPFSYDITEIANFIIGYRQLMAHWHTVLPGRILDVAYESVVLEQEITTRKLLDYCGLKFEPACLEFHKNPTASTTASAVQVRQPLYASSLEEWRYYADQLAPARRLFEAAGINVD